jgi:AcrR family transcriptional regulator
MVRVADPREKMSLLRAAEALFVERGFDGTRVDDIVRRAGVEKETFDLYYESTEAVLKQIVEAWISRASLLYGGPGDYPDAGDDPDGLLDFCIERDGQFYEFLWQTRATVLLLRHHQNDFDYLFEAFHGEVHRRSREWLEQWKLDGLIRQEVDADLAATLMNGAHEQLAVRLLRAEERPELHRWVEVALETFVRAYGTSELVGALERRNRFETTGVRDRGMPLGELAARLRSQSEE